jgi:hypothetical protein
MPPPLDRRNRRPHARHSPQYRGTYSLFPLIKADEPGQQELPDGPLRPCVCELVFAWFTTVCCVSPAGERTDKKPSQRAVLFGQPRQRAIRRALSFHRFCMVCARCCQARSFIWVRFVKAPTAVVTFATGRRAPPEWTSATGPRFTRRCRMARCLVATPAPGRVLQHFGARISAMDAACRPSAVDGRGWWTGQRTPIHPGADHLHARTPKEKLISSDSSNPSPEPKDMPVRVQRCAGSQLTRIYCPRVPVSGSFTERNEMNYRSLDESMS